MADADNIKKTVKDILDVRREFIFEIPDDEIQRYYIASPNGEDIRKADWQYSKVFNQAIVDGFLTQSQMIALLKEKSIINDDYEDRLETVRITLGAEIFKLENLMDDSRDEEKEAVANEVAKLRDELFQLNQQVNGPMANTCENLAEDSRTDFLTSRIIQNKDGSKTWKTYENYRGEDNVALAIKSRFEVMLWLQGLDSDFLEKTPERETMRVIAQARLDKAIEEQEQLTEDAENVEKAKKSKSKEKASVEELELPKETKKPKVTKAPAKKRGRPKVIKDEPKIKKDE